MQRFFKPVFNIRPGEWALVQSFFLYYVSISMFITVGYSIGDSLFLTHIDQQKVQLFYAWGYVGIAAVTICVTWLYAKIMAFVSRIHLVIGIQLLFLLSVLTIRQLISSNGTSSNEWLYLGLVLLLKGCGQLLIVQFFSFAGDYFTIHNARRLYGYIAGGLPVGSILGGMMVSPGVSLIGSINMLYVCMGFLAIGIGVSLFIYRTATPVALLEKSSQSASPRAVPLREIATQPYIKLIFLVTLIGAICFVIVDFQMKVSAKHVYGNSADLATFLGNFYMYAGVMTALVQFTLVGSFLRHFGIISCLLLLPWLQAVMSLLFYASGYGFFVSSPLFIITTANFFRIAFTESLALPSRELLFLPLASQLRVRAQAMMGGIIEPIGLGMGGLLIIGLNYLITPLFQYSALVFSFACVWLILLLWLQPKYRELLSSSLKDHRLKTETLQDVVQWPTHDRILEQLLRGHEPHVVSFTLDFLQNYPLAKLTPQLASLALSPQPAIAAKAIALLGADRNVDHLESLKKALATSSSVIRKAAILSICQIQREASLVQVHQWIKSEDRISRYAAFVACGRYCGQAGKELIHSFLKQMAFSHSPPERRIAATIIREIHDPLYASFLERLLDDSDTAVRIMAVKACREIPSPVLISHLLRLYCVPELHPYVLTALEHLPEQAVSSISNASRDPNLDETLRTLIFRVLASIGGQTAQQTLWDFFSGNSPVTLRVAAGNALWRIALQETQTQTFNHEFERGLRVLCERIDLLNQSYQQIDCHDLFIRQLLHDHTQLEIECLFQLLALHDNLQEIEKVRYNFFASGAVQHANALELLDGMLPRHLAPTIIRLLDTFAEKSSSEAVPLSEGHIRQLAHTEAWLNVIITHYISKHQSLQDRMPSISLHSPYEQELSDQLETIVFLKNVPLFKDVPANYLVPLAKMSHSISLTAGEILFHQGARGDAMYLIRSGQISIHVNGVEVNRMQSGACIGEMAILDGTPRTASCIACEATTLLKISEKNFEMIVKSQTSVALAILQTLAERLRQQTQKMVQHQALSTSLETFNPTISEKPYYTTPKRSFISEQRMNNDNSEDERTVAVLFHRIAFLKDIPLFEEVSEDYLVTLAKMIQPIKIEKGATLFQQGERGNALYLIYDGVVSVHVDNIEVSQLQARQCIGEMAILDGEPRSATCIAQTAAEVWSLSETDFEIIVKSQTSVALALLQTLAERLRYQTTKTVTATHKSPNVKRTNHKG